MNKVAFLLESVSRGNVFCDDLVPVSVIDRLVWFFKSVVILQKIKGVLHIPQILKLVSHNQMQLSVFPKTLNAFKYCHLTQIILFNIIHSFAYN